MGTQTIFIGASVGGASSAAMIEHLCSSVDNLDPASKRGRIVLSTLSAVRSAIPYFGASKKRLQSAIQTISSATQSNRSLCMHTLKCTTFLGVATNSQDSAAASCQ